MSKRVKWIGTGGAIAAAVAAMLIVGLWTGAPNGRAEAAEVLAKAATATSELKSVHIKCRIRTRPGDNFSLIGTTYDFFNVEIWKEFGEQPKWRIEKPGRVAVMDGNSTVMLLKPNRAIKVGPSKGAFDTRWLTRLTDVHGLLTSELQSAVSKNSDLKLVHEKATDGADKLVVTVEAKASVSEDDYLRNKFIDTSENKRVYRFDAKTKLLEELQIYVDSVQETVLVLETTEITYDSEFDPDVFVLDLPKNVTWYTPPQRLPDNEKYERMTPKEAARTFFEACAKEDWEEAGKFLCFAPDERFKKYLGGLEIIKLGEPFKSGGYPGRFIPYEIKTPSGHLRKHKLAMRKDNPAKRFIVDGGL